jgi:hypothetical protein
MFVLNQKHLSAGKVTKHTDSRLMILFNHPSSRGRFYNSTMCSEHNGVHFAISVGGAKPDRDEKTFAGGFTTMLRLYLLLLSLDLCKSA